MANLPETAYDIAYNLPEEEGYLVDETPKYPLLDYLEQGNIVSELEDNIGVTAKALECYGDANESMGPWLKKYKRALSLAKLQAMSGDTEITEKNFPFEGASLVMMPYILEAMLDFNSRSAPELVWADSIIHAKVYGENTKEKENRAIRIADYSNYQLKELIPNWQLCQDKALMILAAIGTFYKKTYYDYDIQEVCSELCLANEVIFNHNYKTFNAAPEKFYPCKYTRNEVIGFIRGKQQWLLHESELEEDRDDFEFIESYIWIDMDGDDLKEPYIAIIYEEKSRIVALYPCFDEDTITFNDKEEVVKIESVEYFTPFYFLPDPEGGPMGLGWGILLGPMFDSINTTMRQLIDSGTLANTAANSGLISQAFASGRGNAVESGPIEVVMGELTPVPNHGGGNLRDNIVQFPFAGPSTVLFQLVEYLIQSSRQMTNAAINVDAAPGEAASLYLARLQQGLKVPNSIIMRVYSCSKKEFQKIAELNYKHYDNEKYNRVLDVDQEASMQNDFNPDDCDVRMAADPSQGSDIERIQRAQVTLDLATNQPQQVINYREAVIQLLEVMNTPDIETLAPEPDPNAVDPMQQLMMAQQAAEMELRKEDQMLRAQEIALKKQKVALDAAKEMSKLGLEADKQEAEIANLYAKSLESLVKAGLASGEDAVNMIERIEQQFIGAQSGGRTSVQTDNTSPAGAVVREPGNESVSPMPNVVQ